MSIIVVRRITERPSGLSLYYRGRLL